MLPVLTPEQRTIALAKAAEARTARSEIKQQLKRGQLTVADLLTRTDDTAAGMKVTAVLTALPGIGKIRAAQLMDKLGIAANRKVRGLGPQQRAALTAELTS